jgi:hypothetical protein
MQTYPHLKIFTRRFSGGRSIVYRYHRKTGVRLLSEPGTPEFDLEYDAAAQKAPQEKSRSIYFAQAKTLGFIKIGAAADVVGRLKEIQTGCPDEVELLGVIRDLDCALRREGELHRRFAKSRHRGEWFHPTDDLLDFIKNIASLT